MKPPAVIVIGQVVKVGPEHRSSPVTDRSEPLAPHRRTRQYHPVADLITVDDPDDPRLRDYTGLTDVELRRKREPAEGLFIAEGEKVIRRARSAGYEMRSMLLSAKWVDVMRDVIDEVAGARLRGQPGARRAGHRLPRAPRRPRLHAAQAAAGLARRVPGSRAAVVAS